MGKTKEVGVPCGSRERVPVWFNLAWTSRSAVAAINVVLLMNLTYYCTDILGLSAATVGIMFIASKVIDAITDLGAGFIIDHTHSKWGKARPYEIFIVFEWLFTAFLFMVPEIGTTAKYVWIFILYVLINAVCTTMLGAADSVYLSRVYTTHQNQIGVMAFNGAIVMLLSIIFNIIFPQFLAGAGTTQVGWTSLAVSMSIPCALIGIIRFFVCKEVKVDVPAETKGTENKIGFKTMMGALLKNKFIFIVIGLMLVTNIVNNMTVATTYYFKYIVGDVGKSSIIGMTGLITPILLIIFPMLSKKIGTSKLLQYAIVIGFVGAVIRTVGGTSMATLLMGSLLMSIATMPIALMINTYLIDCMDYGEWKTGIRVEGLMASTANFAGKLGSALASGLIGFVMGIAGYNGALAVQPDSANTAIIFLFNILPIILFVVMFVLAIMYRVDSIRSEMDTDLAKKHSRVN